MQWTDVYIPGIRRTREDFLRVMEDTRRLLAADAKRQTQPIHAKAHATAAAPRPPMAVSASDKYFNAVEAHLAKGLTPPQARRAVAIHQRDLLDGYLAEFSEKQRAKCRARSALARR